MQDMVIEMNDEQLGALTKNARFEGFSSRSTPALDSKGREVDVESRRSAKRSGWGAVGRVKVFRGVAEVQCSVGGRLGDGDAFRLWWS